MLHAAPARVPVAPNLKGILLLVSSLTVMSGATVAAALPLIETHFAQQPNAGLYARLILTVPALLIAVGSPFAGLFVDRFGRKKLLLVSLVLYALAGSSGALTDSLFVILLGRVFLGIAVAGIMTTSSALVADYFEGKEREQFLGTQAAAMALGGVLFITLGGWLATFSWREPFYVYLSAGALVPFAFYLVREPVKIRIAPPAAGVQVPGALTGTVLWLYLVIFVNMVMFYLVPVQIPFLLKSLPDVSPALTGVAIAAATLAAAGASFNFTRIKSRLTTSLVYGVAFLFTGAGFLLIAFAGQYWQVVAGLFVCGLGNGLVMPNTSLAIMAATPEAVRGRVLGGLSTAVFLGQFFSPIVAAPVAAAGLTGVFGYAGALSVLLAIAIVFLRNRLPLA